MSRRLARILVLSSALAAFGIFAAAPSALAYGNIEQWQVGFSGTCSSQSSCPFGQVPARGATGFWGWCAFGGSNGSSDVGTTGTTADCQITTYFGPGTTFHISYNVTGWVIQANSPFVLPPGLPDFLLTTGTVTLSGPGVPAGIPAHVPIAFPFPNVGCPPMVCDTGIPAVPGHFSFHPSPGVEFNVQVNKLP
jgi:hypothetical protein